MAAPRDKRELDPLVAIVMDSKVIELASTLVAKLEHVAYDETRRGVFKTAWGHGLFSACIKKLMDSGTPAFNIDQWYAQVKRSGATHYDISPAVHAQTVETNWLSPLLEMEIANPGFMLLLHNTLELEDKTHTKLAEQAKDESQYDFLGLGMRNQTLCISAGDKDKRPALLKPK